MHLPDNVQEPEREVLKAVQRAVSADPRLPSHTQNVRIERTESGALRLHGEVDDIAHKRLLVARARSVPAAQHLEVALRLRTAVPMGDEEIRSRVCNLLLQEPSFGAVGVSHYEGGRYERLRPPIETDAELCVRVEDGVVRLEGRVWDSSLKRLAEVMAYWVAGTRDVDNRIEVSSPGPDDDGELQDVVQLVLEKNPLVDGQAVRARVERGVVTLEGFVPTDTHKAIAERDAWYVPGVLDVRNGLRITHLRS